MVPDNGETEDLDVPAAVAITVGEVTLIDESGLARLGVHLGRSGERGHAGMTAFTAVGRRGTLAFITDRRTATRILVSIPREVTVQTTLEIVPPLCGEQDECEEDCTCGE